VSFWETVAYKTYYQSLVCDMYAPPMPEKSAEPWASWTPSKDEEGTEALMRLSGQLPAFFADSTLVSCRRSATLGRAQVA